jgi:hypothetical protein
MTGQLFNILQNFVKQDKIARFYEEYYDEQRYSSVTY